MRKAMMMFFAVGALGLGGAVDKPGASSLQCSSGRQVMIRDLQNLEVVNTSDGAVIKMRADKPADAPDIQRLARQMVDCMSEGASLKK